MIDLDAFLVHEVICVDQAIENSSGLGNIFMLTVNLTTPVFILKKTTDGRAK